MIGPWHRGRMADGFVLRIEGDLASRLQAGAEAVRMSLQDYAIQLIEQALIRDWTEDDRRWGEYLRTGKSIGLEEALAEFDQELDRRLAEKAAHKKTA
jgi:hypothetical protein